VDDVAVAVHRAAVFGGKRNVDELVRRCRVSRTCFRSETYGILFRAVRVCALGLRRSCVVGIHFPTDGSGLRDPTGSPICFDLPAGTGFGSARAFQRCWQPLWPVWRACGGTMMTGHWGSMGGACDLEVGVLTARGSRGGREPRLLLILHQQYCRKSTT
jgi:hypothetical protein